MLKGLCVRVEELYSKPPSFHGHWSSASGDIVLNLSNDLSRPRDWRIMQLYEWKVLIVFLHPAKFCSDRYWDSGDMMVLVCHMISQGHVNKGVMRLL